MNLSNPVLSTDPVTKQYIDGYSVYHSTVNNIRNLTSKTADFILVLIENSLTPYVWDSSSTAIDDGYSTPEVIAIKGQLTGRYIRTYFESTFSSDPTIKSPDSSRSCLISNVIQRNLSTNDPPIALTSWAVGNSIVTGGFSDPDGGTQAYLITANATGPTGYYIRGTCENVTIDSEYMFSGYVKANTTQWFAVMVNDGNIRIIYNLSGGKSRFGVEATDASHLANYIDSSCVLVGNGWYKISVRFKTITSGTNYVFIEPCNKTTGDYYYTKSDESAYTYNWTLRRINVSQQINLQTGLSSISQTTESLSPPYDEYGWSFDGHGAIRYVGGSHVLTDTSIHSLVSGSEKPFTLLWLIDLWKKPSVDANLFQIIGSSASFIIKFTINGKIQVSRTNNSLSTVSTSTTNAIPLVPCVLGVKYTGSQFKIYIDGYETSILPHSTSTGESTYTSTVWGGALEAIDAESRFYAQELTSSEIYTASKNLGLSRGVDISKPWSIILALGQSNAVGTAGIADIVSGKIRFNSARRAYADDSGVDTSLEIYRGLKHSGLSTSTFGPDSPMISKLVEMGKKRCILLKAAWGSVGLYDWVAGGTKHDWLMQSLGTLMGLVPSNSEVKCIVFTGTESDAQGESTAIMVSSNLQALRTQIVNGLGLSTTPPFVFNLLHSSVPYTYTSTVIAQGMAVAVSDPTFHYCDPSSLTLNADNIHYSGPGLIGLGEMYASLVYPFV